MRYVIADEDKVKFVHFDGKFKYVKDAAKEHNAAAAINFGFFSMSANHPVGSYPVGLVIVDGKTKVLTAGIDHFHCVYKKDGHIQFWQWAPVGREWAVRAGPRLLEAGKIPSNIDDPAWVRGGIQPSNSNVARVAIGKTPENKIVLAYWEGASLKQCAQDLLALGCVEALAGDGGGSASWYTNNISISNRTVPNMFIVEKDLVTSGGGDNMLICIDPGHGGSDPGAVAKDGGKESDIALDISLQLEKHLKAMGHKVVMTRRSDTDVYPGLDDTKELQARCDVANKAGANMFVSIHCDAFSDATVSGARVFHYPGSKTGQLTANKVADAMKIVAGKALIFADASKYVLKNTAMPALLIECGFMTNAVDLALLREPSYRDKLALGIAYGIGG
jgi:N-acetylmuramoyl-L-alanine amidase CwlD